MAVYIATYVTITFLPFLFKIVPISQKRSKLYIVIASALLIVGIIALRHPSMGTDLGYREPIGYLSAFHTIDKMSWSKAFSVKYENYETGFVLLTKLIGVFTDNTQVFLAVIAVLSIAPVFVACYFLSDDIVFSTVIYLGLPFFQLNYSGLRQAVSLGFCAIAYIFIKKKKIVLFLLFVALAFFFHSSALYFLFAYPIFCINTPRWGRYLSLMLIPIVFVFRSQIFLLLSALFGKESRLNESSAFMLFLMLSVIYIFCSFIETRQITGMLNLFYIACLIQAMSDQHELVLRVGYYYMMSLVFILPTAIHSAFEKKSRIIVKTVVYTGFIAFGLYQIYTSTWSHAYPYYPFWESVF